MCPAVVGLGFVAADPGVAVVARAATPASGVAHSEQNLAAARFVAPQLGQVMPNGVAHSMQNRAPTMFSVPQFEQITRASLPVSIAVRR